MKDQLKNQSTSDKFQEHYSVIGDLLHNREDAGSAAFKTVDDLKRSLPAGMQKKINPRLLIL